MTVGRRQLLKACGALAGATAASTWISRALGASRAGRLPAEDVRRLTLRNLHTSEVLEVVYRHGDHYVPEALARVEELLRDYRTGDRHAIDPQLLDYLHDVAQRAGVEPEYSVISGYRSPQTNAMLHERSSEVSSHSLHMEGRAIDVRLARIDCADLAAKALEMQRGGVGYYRQSDFVHLDTGRFRTWRG